MLLKILPLQEADLPTCVDLHEVTLGQSDLGQTMDKSTPSAAPSAAPAPSRIESMGTWFRRRFTERDTVCLKVVDTDIQPATNDASGEGEIVSVAIWSFREPDPKVPEEQKTSGERRVSRGGVWDEMHKLWEEFKRDFFPDQDYAYLILLATFPKHQGRGAGSLLVKWGVDEADKRGIITVLQATPVGLGCYLRQGMEVVREVDLDLRPYGVDVTHIWRDLLRQPKSLT